jgi:hypothetical protein
MSDELQALPQHLFHALQEAAEVLERLGIRYALIGGLATVYRSRPRFTQDVDFLMDIPQVQLPRLLDELQARGFSFDLETTIQEWLREHLTVIHYHQVRVDWLKAIIPLYRDVLDRARAEPWLGGTIRIASPEGLILTKLIALRAQDLVDIENLLAANRAALDLDLIRRAWQTVGQDNDARMQQFDEMVRRFYLPPKQGET